MEFRFRVSGRPPRSLGILPGSYNPITRAHLALGDAARALVDEVVLVMPREFPHKRYEGVGLEDRLALLERAVAGRYSVGVSEGGLFLEMARECRAAYGEQCELWIVCGRDAAERIVSWDYSGSPSIRDQLDEYGLLVADRSGSYDPPPELRDHIRRLATARDWGDHSSTTVRTRIAAGADWEHLVPENIVEDVRRLYSGD
jgi:cytidyltransferase-like protein